jgi:(1->4)-alpha-D-glucan 1-alpha-D-glucosylmutase
MTDPHSRALAGPPLTATYRLQLGPHLDFDGARELIPYLARLGVSHLYLSPVLRARGGSTHGYDVVDPSRANPALGGDAAFDRLADAARARGLGVVLDLVPNHMGTGADNPYWDDVLALGEASPYARWFDVDWEAFAGRGQRQLVLPVLGDELPAVLDRGELAAALGPSGFRVRYFDHSLPVDPRTAHRLFAFHHEHAFDDEGDADAVRAARDRLFAEGGESLGADEARRAAAAFAEAAAARPGVRAYVDAALAAFGAGEAGRGRMEALLDLQSWRVTFWRRAWRELNYRRFFDVSELVALRAEDPAVFEATHRWTLERVAAGRVHALRIDHVDGLRDPLAYLRRLRAALDARAPGGHVPVFVEKILVGEERLRPEWPVDGTTGYEALNELESVFVDPGGVRSLERGYRRTLGLGRDARDFAEIAVRGKEYVLRRSFRPEIRRAMRALLAVARGEARAEGTPERRPAALAEALLQLAAVLPVYRTYVTPAGGVDAAGAPGPIAADEADVVLVDEARSAAVARGAADPGAVRFAAAVLSGEVPAPGAPASARVRRAAAEFALRFQQTSGPATAKGVEDTALYRYAPLASLNEVGGEPDRPLDDAPGRLHRANAERLTAYPYALVTVTTHDTKRSADARARLDALSEVAPRWRRLVARWRARHAGLRAPLDGRPGRAPDPGMELLLYQTLVAVWPADGRFAGAAPGAEDRADAAFAERVHGYLTKAGREAKLHTTWTTVRDEYEGAVRAFADALLAGDAGAEFRRELTALVRRVAAAGAWTSLARTLLHAAGPGTPDVYQGDELWLHALVDPDNRRPVDWAARAALVADAEGAAADGGGGAAGTEAAWWGGALAGAAASPGAVKLRLLRRLLGARRDDPALFAHGRYTPLAAEGARAAHVVAFARALGDGAAARAVVAVAPRLVLGLAGDGAPPVGARWDDTRLALPPAPAAAAWTDVVTGRAVAPRDGVVRLAEVLDVAPVALLAARAPE